MQWNPDAIRSRQNSNFVLRLSISVEWYHISTANMVNDTFDSVKYSSNNCFSSLKTSCIDQGYESSNFFMSPGVLLKWIGGYEDVRMRRVAFLPLRFCDRPLFCLKKKWFQYRVTFSFSPLVISLRIGCKKRLNLYLKNKR